MENFDYNARVKHASEHQGITQIQVELTKLGIKSEADQTGGFTMVGRVQVNEDNAYPYLGFNAECLVIYRDEDDEGLEVISDFKHNYEDGQIKSNWFEIAQTIETALAHLNPLRENDPVYTCLNCLHDDFAIYQGNFMIQSGTFLEFYCDECVKVDPTLLTFAQDCPLCGKRVENKAGRATCKTEDCIVYGLSTAL